MSEKVTVYIPTKNRLNLLRRAINSVWSQTYKDIELIVIDDGSDDGTQNYLLAEQRKGRLIAILNKYSMGACVARNKGILSATGNYITGLDDDDFFSTSNRIAIFVEMWKKRNNPKQVLFDSATVRRLNDTIVINKLSKVEVKHLRHSNAIGNQVFATKYAYIDAGLFDPEMPAWQDWDLWYRMAEKDYIFENINSSSYCIDEAHSLNRVSNANQDKIREAMYRLMKKIRNISIRERSSLTIAMLSYTGVKPKGSDLILLFLCLRIKSLLKYILK